MSRIKIGFLSLLFLLLNSDVIAEASNVGTKDQAFRYTWKIKFKKTRTGEDLKYIYAPLPRSNDYQTISNIDTHGGETFENPGSAERYVRYRISSEQHPAEDEWGEVIIEFDYTPTKTEYVAEKVDRIYAYDTSTDHYQRYTKQYYDIIDIENDQVKNISDELWNNATDVYDYAKNCFDYVNENLTFKDIPGMWKPTSEILKNQGGSCGGLSTVLLSLLRCKNIPARHVIAYRHAWAEFYLENYGWIPVDPTFKTFGSVVEGYGLIRSNEIVYKIKLPEDRMGRVDILSKTHLFYPSHEAYDCDREIILNPINH